MKVILQGKANFFPNKEFKTGELITIKEYKGRVDSNFNYPDDHKVVELRGKPKKVHRFNVEYKDKEYQLDMNKTSLGYIVEGLGDESDNWKDKQCVGEVLRMPTGKNMIEFKPVAWDE